MSPYAAYHTAGQALSDRLSLPFSSFRWSGQAGDFSGQGSGASMDFQDHRDYAPGDDPRHINWQAYARSGNYILKQYREEVAPTVDLILDASTSMFFTEEKRQRTCELLYLISACAYKCGAHLNTHLIAGGVYHPISNDELRSSAWTRHLQTAPDDHAAIPPNVSLIPLKPGSLRVFISDLLYQGDPTEVLRPLQQRNGFLFCFAPFIKSEAEPEWNGNYELQDAEGGESQSHKIDASTLDNYKEAYRRHFSLWAEAMQSSQAKLARVSSDHPLSEALAEEAIPRNLLQYTS